MFKPYEMKCKFVDENSRTNAENGTISVELLDQNGVIRDVKNRDSTTGKVYSWYQYDQNGILRNDYKYDDSSDNPSHVNYRDEKGRIHVSIGFHRGHLDDGTCIDKRPRTRVDYCGNGTMVRTLFDKNGKVESTYLHGVGQEILDCTSQLKDLQLLDNLKSIIGFPFSEKTTIGQKARRTKEEIFQNQITKIINRNSLTIAN